MLTVPEEKAVIHSIQSGCVHSTQKRGTVFAAPKGTAFTAPKRTVFTAPRREGLCTQHLRGGDCLPPARSCTHSY